MPKIPTYDQLGQRVKAPTTQLGLKSADFASDNLAVAGSFNRLSNVAYEFGMKEKAENTKAATSEIKALYNDQSNDFIRNSKSLDTASAQAELIDFDKKFEKNYLNRGLSPNQIKDIKTNMTLYQSSKMQVHKNLAFDKGRDRNSTKHNKALNTIMTGMASYVDGPLKEAWRDEAKQIFATAIENGETANFDYKTFEDFSKATEINDFAYDSSNASSIEQIESIKKKLLYANYSPEEKIKIGVMLDKENDRVENEYVDAMQREVFLNPELLKNKTTYESSLKELQSIKNDIEVKNIKGEVLKINPSKLPVALLERVASRIESERINQSNKQIEETSKDLSMVVRSKSLSQLKIDQKKVSETYKDYSFAHQSQIKRLYQDEINTKAKKAIADSQTIIEEITSDIKADGVLSPENEAKIDTVIKNFNLAEEYRAATTFKNNINAQKKASSAFKIVEFQSLELVNEKLKELKNAWKSSGSKADNLAYDSFQAQVTNRNAAMKEDFIGYYIKKNEGVEITTDNMISLQQSMGISSFDIRVTTNAQLQRFEAEFKDPSLNYSEKAKIGSDFLNSFGSNQNRVLRHLVTTGTITTMDNLLMAYPEDVRIKGVLIGNQKDEIKANSDSVYGIPKVTRETISTSMTEKFKAYNQTVLGGGFNNVLGGGHTLSRQGHTNSMRKIAINTANYYIRNGDEDDIETATNRAYQEVIGNHFNLENQVNNVAIRFPKSYNLIAESMSNVLQTSIQNNVEYLKETIEAPPPPVGLPDKATEDAWTKKYYDDLAENGTWRTTTDNTGVYLVDQLGNIVKRKSSTMESSGASTPMAPFVSIKFDSLTTTLDKYQEIENGIGTIVDKKRQLIDYYNQEGQLF